MGKTTYCVQHIWRDVEPHLSAPCKDLAAVRKMLVKLYRSGAIEENDGVFLLALNAGVPTIVAFTGLDLEAAKIVAMPKRRCKICKS